MTMLGNLIVDHPCYGQLTAVRKGYRLSVSHDCIAGSSVKLIEVTCFFLSYRLASYWFELITGSGPKIIINCQRNCVLWFRSHRQVRLGLKVNNDKNA